MKITLFFCLILLAKCQCFNKKSFTSEKYPLSPAMKEFITYVVKQNSAHKGFLFINMNDIELEFSDFSTKMLNKNGNVIVMNFRNSQNVGPPLNSDNFNLILINPEGDLNRTEEDFEKVQVSRTKTLLILTKKPFPSFPNYILNSYWMSYCINMILAYEDNGKIEVFTYNPYLPSSNKFVNLTENMSDSLFADKTTNLYGAKIYTLLTYFDRTKIRRIKGPGGIYYVGKDYITINTIISHLNGKMVLKTMDNVLFNPWLESIDFENRAQRKIDLLRRWEISILVKSERFTTDDEVLDNLYPHTQNDLCSLAPKSQEIPMTKDMLSTFTPSMWVIHNLTPIIVFVMVISIRFFLKNVINPYNLYFDISRLTIVNSIIKFPQNSLERTLLFGWLIYCFILNMYIQSKITSFLATKSYYPEIDTVEDLFKSGFPIYSIPNNIEEIQKKYEGTQYEDYTKSMIALSSNEGLTDQMTYGSDVAKMPVLITEQDIAVFVSRCKNFRKNGIHTYHLVRECFIPRYQSYKVTHRSPLLPILNKKLRRLEEAGFIDLWAKWAIFNETIQGFLLPEDYDETRGIATPLSLNVTCLPFYILFLGYILSSSVFLMELLVYKLLSQPSQSKLFFSNRFVEHSKT